MHEPQAKMKFQHSALLALAATAMAAPQATHEEKPRAASDACTSAVTIDASSNPWKKYTLHPNIFYRKEVQAAVANVQDSSLAASAAKVADVGSFLWM